MYSTLLNNQATGLATLPFTSESTTQGSPTGATFRDMLKYVENVEICSNMMSYVEMC